MLRSFLIPLVEYGFGAMPNASDPSRKTAWQRFVKLEFRGSSQRVQGVGATATQHVPVLV